MNVCTLGYSTAFWHWERWEREIDWMAMNGINLPLAFVGQEYVWQGVFADLGMNATQVAESWFSNAAFLPWNRMGNLNNWAGPLSQDFITAQVVLQKQILQRQRAFGMKPILPGFAGHVPPAFVQAFPKANVSTLTWAAEFGSTYTLSPQDPMFHQIGNSFINQLTNIYGTDHLYNADPFNEVSRNGFIIIIIFFFWFFFF
jgi:alpha-N-acetylglucosaminidase